MAITKYKSTTNGRRNMTSSDLVEITGRKPEKALLESQNHTADRNSYGYITVRHRDGDYKQKHCVIDPKRNKDDVKVVVKTIEYDSNRTVNIALLHYAGGIKAYISAPKDLKVGAVIESGPNAGVKPGNVSPLSAIPTGTETCNIELKPGKGGQLVRSAGTITQVLGNDGKYTSTRLQSGEVRKVLPTRRATIGSIGSEQHSLVQLGKAGHKRRLGKRPQSRGSIMSPNDHPYGGGEDKAPVGRPQPMTPWGKKLRSIRTRNSRAGGEELIIRHRKDNK